MSGLRAGLTPGGGVWEGLQPAGSGARNPGSIPFELCVTFRLLLLPSLSVNGDDMSTCLVGLLSKER